MNNHYFHDIAEKFQHNIYGTNKGRLRHLLLCHRLASWLEGPPLRVLDAGAGTGIMAEEFLKRGHEVVLQDGAKAVLDLASSCCGNHSQAQYIHGDILDFNDKQGFDLVICHAVLEWCENPLVITEHLQQQLRVGGYLSLSVFNQDAKLFTNMTYKNFDYIKKGMQVKNQVRLNPKSPIQPKWLLSQLQRQGLEISSFAGIRCFHDYLKDPLHNQQEWEDLLAFELQYGGQEPYCFLGKYFHVLAQVTH